ncbi:FlgK family flagellar hook-associated protein [Idiomarina aquatica]|uniref:Flagellar hook-associated protein 1 n=1 Tax=Idiomarina aquatica TaxID=1327752 RepID=A0AA94EH17_9GAMM|nr:flagellar basal body rod C-terminal domain-containing protein [Idiomarina aquatica]RUO45072.1 flagellar hook-associated protein FlgK [Idiomarina aquatica]
MSFDLLEAGKRAVLAHQQSLQTTGRNINNVNNDTYVRERTNYVTNEYGVIEGTRTERMINSFINKQLNRDISRVEFNTAKLEQAEQLDKLLGNRDTNVASAVESFFNAMQDANSDPSSITARQIVITEAEGLATQFNSFGGFLNDQEDIINQRLSTSTEQINSITENLAELNIQLQYGNSENKQSDVNSLMNQRDAELRKLAELVQFQTVEHDSGAISVNMANGTPLVLENGKFNTLVASQKPDTGRLQLFVESQTKSQNETRYPVRDEDVGGAVGGYLDYRDNVLLPAQKKLGQLAVRVADALNTQNQKGMDLDNQLGAKIFDLSDTKVTGLGFSNNSGSGEISMSVLEGNSEQFGSENLLVKKISATEYTVQAADENGAALQDSPAITIDASAGAGDYEVPEYGVMLSIDNAGAAVGDQFLTKPAEEAALNIQTQMTRPQDLALASPVRLVATSDNEGVAELELSALNEPGAFYNGNALDNDAPQRIEFSENADGSFDITVLDGDGDTFGTITNTNDFENIISRASGGDVDYDVTLDGTPVDGDSFSIQYNTDGINDNRNGQLLTDLQRENTVRRSVIDSEEPTLSFNESFARIVSEVGSKVSQTRISQETAEAIKSQTETAYESVSGVNLEEEAANLIQFEQAYNASARIITVAQTTFDTLLQSTR